MLGGGLASSAGRWEGFSCEPSLRRKSRLKGVVGAQKKVGERERVRTV